jgi:hypothetical protein
MTQSSVLETLSPISLTLILSLMRQQHSLELLGDFAVTKSIRHFIVQHLINSSSLKDFLCLANSKHTS